MRRWRVRPDCTSICAFGISTARSPTQRAQCSHARVVARRPIQLGDVRVDLRRPRLADSWAAGHAIRQRAFTAFDSRFEWPDMSQAVRAEKGFFHGLSGHFGIHANGSVVPCCLDHKAEIKLGNVFADPLTEILASPRAVAIRDGFARGELVEDLCRRCAFIGRF